MNDAASEAMVESLDVIMCSLNPAMVIVTAAADGDRSGCLVGFHAQSSIEPKRYGLWLSKANHTYRTIERAPYLGVHLLTHHDHDLAALFGTVTGDHEDKLAQSDYTINSHGVPVLLACPNRFTGRVVGRLDDGGDHTAITVEPLDVHTAGPFTALRLADVTDLQAGHPAR